MTRHTVCHGSSFDGGYLRHHDDLFPSHQSFVSLKRIAISNTLVDTTPLFPSPSNWNLPKLKSCLAVVPFSVLSLCRPPPGCFSGCINICIILVSSTFSYIFQPYPHFCSSTHRLQLSHPPSSSTAINYGFLVFGPYSLVGTRARVYTSTASPLQRSSSLSCDLSRS